jgi:hypothetical protein
LLRNPALEIPFSDRTPDRSSASHSAPIGVVKLLGC